MKIKNSKAIILYVMASIFMLLIASNSQLYARRITRVRYAVGECKLERTMSLAISETIALEEAKKDAIRKAGLAERIYSTVDFTTNEDIKDFNNIISEILALKVYSMVTITKQELWVEQRDDGFYTMAKINAKIYEDDITNKNYMIDTEGIGPFYDSGDNLVFLVTPYGFDSYIKIFWFVNDRGELLYPNENDPSKLFTKDCGHVFPNKEGAQFFIKKRNIETDIEQVCMIIIATTTDVPFNETDISYNKVLNWYFKIPVENRAMYRTITEIR